MEEGLGNEKGEKENGEQMCVWERGVAGCRQQHFDYWEQSHNAFHGESDQQLL